MKRFFKIVIVLTICASFILSLPVAEAAYKKGDVNNDGTVSTEDAIIVLRIAARQRVATSLEKQASDIDNDGIITTEDARQTLITAINPPVEEGEYAKELIERGFPKSYTDDLVDLHEKYPEWVFEPFITGLKWDDALKGERTPHKKQVISPDVQASYKCACSSCHGVVQESGGWVSASEEAVAYYLDPRNFLNEEYIFQFESTAYDESQTQEAVETIIRSTWMYNSYITYLDASGNTISYTENGQPLKYSEAIMRAAKDSGMSAYYLASKIVQEVGSTTSSSAGGSSGKCSPYNGIYNYYNIGANTGALDGLAWANGYMKTSKSTTLYKSAGETTLCTVPSGNTLYFMGEAGNFYKVKTTVSGTSYTGYVAKSDVSVSTSYGRPWDNPYKSIYYGAKYIHSGFSDYQFTGYLQKFNVNKDSGSLYDHEYMANVRAAASEAYSSYRAYTAGGIMANRKVFSIPVFIDMPGGDLSADERFTEGYPIVRVSSATATSITLSWQTMAEAKGYEVYKKSGNEFKLVKTTTETSYTDSSISADGTATYKVRAYKTIDGEKLYSLYCPEVKGETLPAVPSGLAVSAYTDNTATIKWNAVTCTGYAVYRSGGGSAYALVGNVTTNSFTDKNLLSGTKYSYKIKSHKGSGSKAVYSGFSSAVSLTTTGEPAQTQKTGTVKVSDALNIRKEPNTSATVLCTLPNGFVVDILSTSNGWHKVTFVLNGITYTGYASADFIVVQNTPVVENCPYNEPTSTLSIGSSGEGVKWLQWHLWQLGYLNEADVDGSFGNGTLNAVVQFQTDSGISADGVVGSGTRTAIKNTL